MHVTFCTQKYNFDMITAVLTDISDIGLKYRLNVFGGPWVGMGQGVKTGIGHGGITCVLQS